MANVVNIRKEGQFVVFTLDDKSTVQYDLKNQTTIGKKGSPVKGLSSQLKGVMLADVEDKFEDRGFYEFLHKLRDVKSYPCYSLAGVLSRAPEFEHLEGYCRLGIKADVGIRYPVSGIPRPLLNWIRDAENPRIVLDSRMVEVWKADPGVFQSILSQRNDINAPYVDGMIDMLINERRHGIERYGTLNELIGKYAYNPTTLVNYISEICMYEGFTVGDCAYQLRDYAMMQTAMTEGAHSFEKYPRHLLTVHRIAQRNYSRLRNFVDDERFKATYDGRLEMRIGDYTFICPEKASQIKDEAVQQQHCVAAYIDRVLEGKCHIVFMRKRDDPSKSCVTLEVVKGRVVQAKGSHNREVTADEAAAINLYVNRLSKRLSAASEELDVSLLFDMSA